MATREILISEGINFLSGIILTLISVWLGKIYLSEKVKDPNSTISGLTEHLLKLYSSFSIPEFHRFKIPIGGTKFLDSTEISIAPQRHVSKNTIELTLFVPGIGEKTIVLRTGEGRDFDYRGNSFRVTLMQVDAVRKKNYGFLCHFDIRKIS